MGTGAGSGRGGARKGSGRPPGAKNRRTRDIAEALAADGRMTPLEYMLRVMRDSKADKGRRDEMAKAAAPYMHPRIATVEVANKPGEELALSVREVRRVVVKAARVAGDA